MLLLIVAPAFGAGGRLVDLQGGQDRLHLDARMAFVPDRGQTLAELAKAYRSGRLTDAYVAAERQAAPYHPIWGVVELKDGSFADGRTADSWIGLFGTYGVLKADAYLLRSNGLTDFLLSYDYERSFDASQFAITQVKTRAITLAPGEQATLLIKVTHGPVRQAAFDLLTEDSLAQYNFTKGLGLSAYYAFGASALFFFMLFQLSLKNWTGALYGLLFIFALAFLAYMDLLFFRFLYPQRPAWHIPSGIALINLMNLTGLYIVRKEIAAAGWSGWLSWLGRTVWLLPIAALLTTPIVPTEATVNFSYFLFLLMLGLQIAVSHAWARAVRHIFLARLIFGFVFISLALLLLYQLFGPHDLGFPVSMLIKIVYVLTALLTLGTITLELVIFRREHEAALQDRVVSLEREKQQNEKLLEAERAYSRARDQAVLRQRQLAVASHDIRQPLTSLRLTFDSMAAGLNMEVSRNLREALNYLESLSTDYLRQSRPGEETVDEKVAEPQPETSEPYSLSVVLGAVRQMFNEEATSKQIRLKVVSSELMTTVPPLAIMRIVSNLTSNAVKYTDRGKVVVGVRRAGGRCQIMVLDTGRGMTKEERTQFRAHWQKGAQSDGEGLGLAICHQLAEANGLKLAVHSTPGRGTVFSLEIPVLS